MTESTPQRRLASAYLSAKQFVLQMGYEQEIDWQERISLQDVCESDFLREAAWVILCSGMRERIVRARFSAISESFLHWKSAGEIVFNKEYCATSALRHFANKKKVDAICEVAESVEAMGFASLMRDLSESGPSILEQFPFVGPVTSIHLAKNIGLPLAKPDRHLVRIAGRAGISDVYTMCKLIAEITADSIPVIDIVLWRYATLVPRYGDHFDASSRPASPSN